MKKRFVSEDGSVKANLDDSIYLLLNNLDGVAIKIKDTPRMKGHLINCLFKYIKRKHKDTLKTTIFKKIFDSCEIINKFFYKVEVFRDLILLAHITFNEDYERILIKLGKYLFEEFHDNKGSFWRFYVADNLEDYIVCVDSLFDILNERHTLGDTLTKRKDGRLIIKVKLSFSALFGPIIFGYYKAVAKNTFGITPKYILQNKGQHINIVVEPQTPEEKIRIFSSLNPLEVQEESDSKTNPLSVVRLADLVRAWPYHIVLNQKMQLLQIGHSLKKIVNLPKTSKANFDDFFYIDKPIKKEYNFEKIEKNLKLTFFIYIKPSKHLTRAGHNFIGSSAPYIKGMFYSTMLNNEHPILVFLGSTRIFSVKEFITAGVSISDVPVFDASRRSTLNYQKFLNKYNYNIELESYTEELSRVMKNIYDEKKFCDSLLYNVIPEKVADIIKQGRPVPPVSYKNATVMFAGIVGFKDLCSQLHPLELFKFLNDLYLIYDAIVYKHENVYKIETAGDKYMLVSGLPNESATHAVDVLKVAKQMMEASSLIKIDGKPIRVTYGINTGEIVAGVVGSKLHRYCVIGSTVNIASRTETTGIKGRINLTESSYQEISKLGYTKKFDFEKRENVVMKGLSKPVSTYVLREETKRADTFNNNNHMLVEGSRKISTPFTPEILTVLKNSSQNGLNEIADLIAGNIKLKRAVSKRSYVLNKIEDTEK